jgi:enoyl-CoA hydratase
MGICGAEWFAHPMEMGVRKAKELLFTADFFTAEEARQMGMVNRVVPRADLEDACLAIARKIAAKPLFALRMTKEVINLAQDTMGRDVSIRSAVGYHHLCHTHWRAVSGIPIDPDFLSHSKVAEGGGLSREVKQRAKDGG